MVIRVKKALVIGLLIIFLLNLVSASYILGDVYIYENGDVRFDVESDVALDIEGLSFRDDKITGITELLTSKSGGVWTFELDSGEYDSILLDVHLPRNLDAITLIEGVDSIIDIENKVITLIDSGALAFSVSYKLKNSMNYSWLFWPVLLLVIVVVYVLIKKSRKRREHLNHVFPLINENEQKIIELLMKKPMRQKEIRKALGFPKASFSRYLVNLEKKKLIIRQGEGKNKVVRLK